MKRRVQEAAPYKRGENLWCGWVSIPAPAANWKRFLLFRRGRRLAGLRAAQVCRPYGPHPLRFARHLPLKGKAEGDRKGRPYGGMRTGSVCSVKPGAEQKPHRLKFWGSQGPVAREETQIATQILRAGNIAGPNKYASPVMGVLGGGRHGGGRLCRTADCARPLAVLKVNCPKGAREGGLGHW